MEVKVTYITCMISAVSWMSRTEPRELCHWVKVRLNVLFCLVVVVFYGYRTVLL
jgi:hypothetical protein